MCELSISLDPSADKNLEQYLDELNQIGGIAIHLDIMRKVQNGVLEIQQDRCSDEQIRYVLQNSRHPIDVHIMATFAESRHIAQNIMNWCREDSGAARVRCICTHEEEYLARSQDKSAAIVMSVKPGKSGQMFNPAAIDRIKELQKTSPEIRIIVDGGINAENIAAVRDALNRGRAGANTVVVGNFIYSKPTQKERAQAVKELSDILRK